MSPRRATDEDGFTLPELLITTMLVAILSLTLFSVSDALTRTVATTESRSRSVTDARTALERMGRDLRAANPINQLVSGPTSQYKTSVSFDVFCSGGQACTSSGLRPVRYSVSNGVLTQTIGTSSARLLGPEGTPTLPTRLRRGAIVNAADQPVFTYFRADGSEITTADVVGEGIPTTYFRDCTKRVKIRLLVRSEPNKSDKITELTTIVTLRNHNEVNPC